MNGVRKTVVAIEGPCCAGKTTLSERLLQSAAFGATVRVRDYSDHVGGGRYLPPPVPETEAEERAALNRFIELEHARSEEASTADVNLVIVDRSLHTLIGHCSGIERLVDFSCVTLAREMLKAEQFRLWPEFIVYLDAAVELINARNSGKFATGSVFMDDGYNCGFRDYFRETKVSRSVPFAWIDGSLPRDDVYCAASTAIQSHMNSLSLPAGSKAHEA